MVKVKCQHCGKEWEYTGKSKVMATCPDCQKKTKIQSGEK